MWSEVEIREDLFDVPPSDCVWCGNEDGWKNLPASAARASISDLWLSFCPFAPGFSSGASGAVSSAGPGLKSAQSTQNINKMSGRLLLTGDSTTFLRALLCIVAIVERRHFELCVRILKFLPAVVCVAVKHPTTTVTMKVLVLDDLLASFGCFLNRFIRVLVGIGRKTYLTGSKFRRARYRIWDELRPTTSSCRSFDLGFLAKLLPFFSGIQFWCIWCCQLGPGVKARNRPGK